MLTVSETTKNKLAESHPEISPGMRGMYAGAVAGTIGLVLSVPVELLKNRA